MSQTALSVIALDVYWIVLHNLHNEPKYGQYGNSGASDENIV